MEPSRSRVIENELRALQNALAYTVERGVRAPLAQGYPSFAE